MALMCGIWDSIVYELKVGPPTHLGSNTTSWCTQVTRMPFTWVVAAAAPRAVPSPIHGGRWPGAVSTHTRRTHGANLVRLWML